MTSFSPRTLRWRELLLLLLADFIGLVDNLGLLIPFCYKTNGKRILEVPDTGTRVLDNTRPFLCSSIVSFWITPARSKERKYHIFRQYWYIKNVPVFTNTGTFQNLGSEVYVFLTNIYIKCILLWLSHCWIIYVFCNLWNYTTVKCCILPCSTTVFCYFWAHFLHVSVYLQ